MNKTELQLVLTALTGGHTSLGLTTEGLKRYRAAVDCLESAIAQPEQEPIGWLHRIAMKTRPHDSRWVYAETASVVNDGYVVLETRRA